MLLFSSDLIGPDEVSIRLFLFMAVVDIDDCEHCTPSLLRQRVITPLQHTLLFSISVLQYVGP